ncbi:dihydrofolate reductase [Limnohabitans sp. Rim11]|uniref:dihydrofolate reductase n=1 Tax=Limnohabitans sp. Rim11 TaxID=1100719 RepID=UPI000AEE4F53|nr:dihydrofolate reductase [Limnohabitans sp. Rim11]
MKLKLIYARAANGVIGLNNQMPWHLPEDLAHFKRTTLGCPVLMGRKTWESIPAKFRPLPGRANLVITRQPDWQAEGAHVVHSLEEGLTLALAHCPEGKDLWVMGGAEIYAQAASIAEEAVVTEIEADYEGDAFAPQLGAGWQEVSRESHVSSTGLKFCFVTYRQSI